MPSPRKSPIRKRIFWCACVATAVFATMLACSAFYHLFWLEGGQRASLAIERGGFYFQLSRQATGFGYIRPPYGWSLRPNSLYSPGGGRTWMWRPDVYLGPTVWFVKIPLWLPMLTSAAAAILARPRRIKPDTCPTCRYDRRGLPADAKCPECGAEPAAP